jgi:hypothetical protein
MVEPITIGAVLGALASIGGFVVSAINRLTENPLMAYFLVLSVLVADGGMSFVYGWQGVVGGIFSFVFNQVGVPIIVYSWQIMIFFGILPIINFVVKASASR